MRGLKSTSKCSSIHLRIKATMIHLTKPTGKWFSNCRQKEHHLHSNLPIGCILHTINAWISQGRGLFTKWPCRAGAYYIIVLLFLLPLECFWPSYLSQWSKNNWIPFKVPFGTHIGSGHRRILFSPMVFQTIFTVFQSITAWKTVVSDGQNFYWEIKTWGNTIQKGRTKYYDCLKVDRHQNYVVEILPSLK